MSAARRTLTDLVLTVAAVLGVLCAVLAVAGAVAGFGVVLFRTGSMAPTIPAGSAALVRTVAAADLRIGDVVTVDRPGQLPVTHRIVQVTAVADEPEFRDLVLRGDANAVADPLPYRVDSARRVLTSVPGVASMIAGWGQPMVLGGVALLVAAGVTVAFWPRRPRPTTQSTPGGARDTSRPAHRGTGCALTVVALAAVGVLTVPATPAQAAAVDDDPGAARHLTVDSDLPAGTGPLVPGDVRDWFLTVRTTGVTGSVTRQLEAAGVDDPALTVRVERCADRACPQPVPLVDPVVPAPGLVVMLPEQPAPGTELLRVRVSLSPDAGPVSQGVAAALRFTAVGDGEIIDAVGPGGEEAPAEDATDPAHPNSPTTPAAPIESSTSTGLADPATPALATTGGTWRLLAVLAAALSSTGLVAAAVTRIVAREEER